MREVFPVRRIEPLDEEIAEEWSRDIASGKDKSVHGVGAHRAGGIWRVTVWAMEFVREEPLESELREAIRDALERVPGASDVDEEDREVWVVGGSPSGEALVVAVAAVVDARAERIRLHIDSL